jgi:hypothetical protein
MQCPPYFFYGAHAIMKIFLLFAGINAVAFLLDYFIGVRGLEKKVAEEGNWAVNKLYGSTPTPKQLLIGSLPQDGLVVIVAFTLALCGTGAAIVGAGLLTGASVRHIQNYFAWKKLGA